MALIYCPECRYTVSEYAKQCPKCSYPINNNSYVNVITCTHCRGSGECKTYKQHSHTGWFDTYPTITTTMLCRQCFKKNQQISGAYYICFFCKGKGKIKI